MRAWRSIFSPAPKHRDPGRPSSLWPRSHPNIALETSASSREVRTGNQARVFCKRKETRGFAGSPGTQREGAPKSCKLHPEPQRPSEDSCEGLHHLSLKDDAVPLPPSSQSLEPKSKSGNPPALSPILWMPVSGCRSLCGEAALAGVAEGDGRSLGRAGRVPGARGRQTAYLGEPLGSGRKRPPCGSSAGAHPASGCTQLRLHGLLWHDPPSSAPSASWHAPRAAAPWRAHPPVTLWPAGWAWSRGALAEGTPTAQAAGLGAREPDPRCRHPNPRLPDAARVLVCRKGQNCDTEGRVLALNRVKKKKTF